MSTHHLIIAGTGRAGTTFLVGLLTELGLDTGYDDPHAHVDPVALAGMEWDFGDPDLPYVLKSPWFSDVLGRLITDRGLVIDHALIPIRDLFGAAESRRQVEARTDPDSDTARWLRGRRIVPGGPVPEAPGENQEQALARRLHAILMVLAQHEIPTTLVEFPLMVRDPDYLRRRLAPVLPNVGPRAFREAFDRVVRPEAVHEFRA